MTDASRIFQKIEQGDPAAAADLLPLVYDELRRLAAAKLAHENDGHTLDATSLVHEAYVRLVDVETPQDFNSRGHFFAAAAEAMRRILVEAARRRHTLKKGGALHRVDADPDGLGRDGSANQVLEIDEALGRLGQQSPDIAKLVELKYFAGLTLDQVAETQGISVRTAHRHWAYAKAWLRQEIGGDSSR